MVAHDVSLCNIIFLDIEPITKDKDISEYGIIYGDDELSTSSTAGIRDFIKEIDPKFLAGHNFIDFDLNLLKETSLFQYIKEFVLIDTLPLSLLFFSEKTLHSLPKNYKNEDDIQNKPVEDSKITRQLFKKIEDRFLSLDKDVQDIFYSLLKDKYHFSGFFKYMQEMHGFDYLEDNALNLKIIQIYKNDITNSRLLFKISKTNPVELAYILALISSDVEVKSHPPKVLYDYPQIVDIQKELCFDFKRVNDELSSLSKEVFGFGEFREFPKLNPTIFGKSFVSQRDIIEASLKDDSFLAVLPTGGGKTFTFWLPSIIKAKSYKSLTVVISPLQALIEDHISSFNKNVDNYKAVAISGFLTPLERAEAVEQVISGEADILYIAPESLRSNMIFNILKNRVIERFVVDEAHCLSTWGNDFRQDYYYICEYVNELLEKKPFQKHIPISCFTATAKPSVIKDIKDYFFKGLDIKLDEYIAIPERKNLSYKSIPSSSKDKYVELLNLVNAHDGSTLIYIPSSTKKCDEIAEKLSLDTDKRVKSFHSKLESSVKMEILKDYISDEVDIIVATTAFGMGVDKPNITNVIHYEMSDSLENYAQEAGRGARDKDLTAFCPILYDEDDLDKHFVSLNRSKITADEINSIFRVLKKTKGDVVTKTAFELANEAGWDVEDSSNDYTTKVKTALLELEREGYIDRKRNRVRFFADSVASNSIEKLDNLLAKSTYSEEEKNRLKLVHQTILGRGKTLMVQVDELAHLLGYKRSIISETIEQLKEMEILGNSKDLILEIKKSSIVEFKTIKKIELILFDYLSQHINQNVTIKELHEYVLGHIHVEKNSSSVIKEVLKGWRDKSTFVFSRICREKDLWYFSFVDVQMVKDKIDKKHIIAEKVLDFFSLEIPKTEKKHTVEFSLKNIRELTHKEYTAKEIDKTLLYLHQLHILELLNGRFINYSPMQIEKNSEKFLLKRKYTKTEYKKRLEKHYISKIESIHIMGEYAKRLQQDNSKALQFMRDYFTSPYEDFKKKYNLLKKKITRPITERRYEKIFSKMSPVQQEIISDKETKAMMILAGPGSGKTKVLVHKIASLILTEDIKPEQFMMLTFSRSASREFKSRLNTLIGSLSFEMEISTFHAYALNKIARVARDENEDVLKNSIIEATKQIRDKDITLSHKTVLILDEFQDINEHSFELVKAIYEASDKELKIIAVGDDDQCINTHAGASIHFIEKFKTEFGIDDNGNDLFKQYELLINFRSKRDIVEYSNSFISKISNRYKSQALESFSKERGKVCIYSCKSNNLISPVIKLIQKENSKNIAILAYKNTDVMQIYSQLQEIGINAKYILDREKFELKNIVEIVEFDKVINSYLNARPTYSEEDFEKALLVIEDRFKGSKNLYLLKRVVDKFLYESHNYYASEWLAYLDEIKLEEFDTDNKSIVISTIHKSKGLEFDEVILLVNSNPKTDEEKRVYYVGMTRAKNKVTILRHGDEIKKKEEYAEYIFDNQEYTKNSKIETFVLGLKDIKLGYDYQKYYGNFDLIAGFDLKISKTKYGNLCLKYDDKIVSIFSQTFEKEISKYSGIQHSYKAFIDYVVVWYDKENKDYIKHPLCKITIRKS